MNASAASPEGNLFRKKENLIGAGLFLFSLSVYLCTMNRSVGLTDSGELAAVIFTLGIAHPTGYPLFTLLGRVWGMLPLPGEEILRLNILAALYTALAVGLFFKTSLIFCRSRLLFSFKERKQNESEKRDSIPASALAALVVGFSTTFWSQSAAIEVYALHLVLLLCTIGAFISGLEEQLENPSVISRRLMLFAYLFGLSFTNHMTTILLIPACVWLSVHVFRKHGEPLRRILFLLPFFFLGISVYGYLMVRSAGAPNFDWGHPATFERFFWHISGKQFRIWMFSGWSVVQKQLSFYVKNISSEFFFLTLICLAAGIGSLWKKSKRLLVFLLVLFVTTVAYSVNYDIFDIHSYFLLSFLVIGWILVFGFESVLSWGARLHRWPRRAVILFLFACPLFQISDHWETVDETKNILPHQFVQNAFSRMEPGAVVIASQWDYFVSPSYYYQWIRGERPDITIIDKSLLQNRSWYFLQLKRQVPWLMQRIDGSAKTFLSELYRFEHDLPFQYSAIQLSWQKLLSDIAEKASVDHPVYVDGRIQQEFPSSYRRVPAGLFLRLSVSGDTTAYKTGVLPFSPWDSKQPAIKDFERYYLSILGFEVNWLLKKGRAQEAERVLHEVLRVEPGNASAVWLLRQMGKK